MSISKNGIPLTTLVEWEKHAGPKRPNQWVDGRSAKEAARAWLENGGKKLPEEILSALINHKGFGPVQSWQAEPEVKLSFDSFKGETRNSDLVVYAQDSHGPFLIAIEAKADEPFGETVAETLAAAVDRYLRNSRSNGVVRTEQLAAAILGPRKIGAPPLKDIRYQLLTACAGALCEAQRRGYSRALMLVQEFITVKTSDEKHFLNGADLDTFVKRLTHGSVCAMCPGRIYGPFTVPSLPLLPPGVKLFIGKVSRNLRTSGT